MTSPAVLHSSSDAASPEVEAVAAIEPRPILGRRPAVIAPLIVVALLALAYLAGQAMHRTLSADDAAGSLLLMLGAGGAATALAVQARRHEREPVADARIFAGTAMLLTSGLSALAALHDGLASPYLAALPLGAAYAGLVLSPRMSALVAGFMTASLVPVAVLGASATWLQALTIFLLVPGGRVFGLLCGTAHRRAERVAQQLTRADRLTRTLSRRGFLEELDHALVALRRVHAPIALFLVDLDGFKEVNSARGGAGGDELLAWCGGRLSEILPRGSSVGRLGGDEFGVATVGMNRAEADRFAIELRDTLGERHPVSIGVATSEDSTVAVSDLLRVGNAALRRAKDEGDRRIHGLVAGGLRPEPGAAPPAPLLTYERLRRHGGRPRQPSPSVLFGKFLSFSLIGLALVGAILSVTVVLTDATAPSFWTTMLRYGWLPWVVACLACAAVARFVDPLNMRQVNPLIVAATVLVGGGISVVALAQGGGVVEPIVAGLALRVLFDTAVAFKPQALITLAGTLAFYLAIVALGPASSLWAAPFHLVLIASAYGVGQVAQHGFIETTDQWLQIARTDVLTGLRNRLGVEEEMSQLLHACAAEGSRVAVVSVDIDDMRTFNDTHGHAAGDAAIQRMARQLTTTFAAARTTGRLGADEFIAAVPVLTPSDADRLTATIEAVLRPELPVSAGVAVYPDHGRDLDGLLHVADVRRRSAKAMRRERESRDAQRDGARDGARDDRDRPRDGARDTQRDAGAPAAHADRATPAA